MDALVKVGDEDGSPAPGADNAPGQGLAIINTNGTTAGVSGQPATDTLVAAAAGSSGGNGTATAITATNGNPTTPVDAAATAAVDATATAADAVVVPKKKKPAKIPKTAPKISQLDDNFVAEITPDICADMFKRLIQEWEIEIKPPLMPSKIPPELGKDRNQS